MNIIASAGALPQSNPTPSGDADASLAEDSSGLSFENLLSETPGQRSDDRDETETGEGEGPDVKDPMLSALLPLLQPPIAPLPPPPALATPTIEGGEANPAGSEFSCSDTASALGNPEFVRAGGLASSEPRPADPAAEKEEAASPAIPATTRDVGAVESEAIATGPATAMPVPAASSDSQARRKSPGLPNAVAAAEFSSPGKELASGIAAEKTQSPRLVNENGDTATHGTAVAMERRAMPESSNEHHLNSTAKPAAGASAADTVLPARLAPAQQKPGTPDEAEPTPSASAASPAIAASSTHVATGNLPDRKNDLGPAEFRAAARFVEQTMDLAERVSVRGGEHVEVQMRLIDGHEVTVSLHLEKGEWRPVFKTDTDALCHALEQTWQQSAAQSPGRTVRFGTPVFESLQSRTDTGGGMHQQPDARDRSFSRHVPENVPAPGPVRHSKAAAPVRPARLAVAGGVHLYA